MAGPKRSLPSTKTHVRCGCPGCDWRVPLSSFGAEELRLCRRQFREHCIERHGLDPNDTERVAWFNLESLTLKLLA